MRADDSIKHETETEIVVAQNYAGEANMQEESEAVESIFFQIQDHSEMSTTSIEIIDASNVKEEYLNEEYIEDENPQYEFMEIENKMCDEAQYPIKQEFKRDVSTTNKSKGITKQRKTAITLPVKVLNIKQLREDQEKFKVRLQEAVNSVRNNLSSIAKAAKMYEVSTSAIERNLKNYKSSW